MGKILMVWQLPKGGVALLISLFAAKTIAVYLSVYPLYRNGQAMAVGFGRHWPKLLVLPLGLLAIAVTVRIHAHGITADRYIMLLCLLWTLIAMFEKLRLEEEAPRRIVLWAVLLLFLTSFGPWGVDNVSTVSQMARLEQVLEKNYMLSQGRLVAPSRPVSFTDRATISSVVDYLVETNKIGRIKPWFADKYQGEIGKPKTQAPYESAAQVVLRDMGLEYVSRWEKEGNGRNQNDIFTYNGEWNKKALSISGYDYSVETSNFGQMCSAGGSAVTLEREGGRPSLIFSVNFDSQTAHLTLANNATHKSLLLDLNALFKRDEWFKRKAADKLVLEGENSEMKVRMIIKSVYGKFEGEKPVISSLTTVLLIKLK
jgi:hypothetical protein